MRRLLAWLADLRRPCPWYSHADRMRGEARYAAFLRRTGWGNAQ